MGSVDIGVRHADDAVIPQFGQVKLFAETAGIGLGDILSLSEVISNPQPVPTYRKTMQAEAASSVPIAQGEQIVAVDVNIVWEID